MPVRYKPNDPGDAGIDTFAERWLGPIIAGGIGLLFSVIGGVLFWAGRTGRFTARGSSSSGPERGASALHHPDFPPARPGTNGYDVGAVHILLARIEQAYGELAVGRPPQLTPAELAQTQLAQAYPGRPGYDQLTVDQYLSTVHADLGRARTAH